MDKHEFLDHKGWRYEWIDGILQTKDVPKEKLEKLGERKPLAIRLHEWEVKNKFTKSYTGEE